MHKDGCYKCYQPVTHVVTSGTREECNRQVFRTCATHGEELVKAKPGATLAPAHV